MRRFVAHERLTPIVYEMRVYTLQPGKVAAFQELIEKEALPVISKYSIIMSVEISFIA